jgi:RNA polymerase sigma-70 factor (ECF subfamily)
VAEEQALARDDFDPACQRSPADFTGIVNQHWTAVYKLSYTLTGNVHDSEDLTQETFLKALNRIETFQANTNMRAWLLRIASNAFFDQQRKRQRANQQQLPEDVPAVTKPVEHSLETVEQTELLKAALTELSELTRMVFHLRAQEELSFREIAEIVGTSEEAARWHMFEARNKLVKRLAEKKQ